MNIPIPVDPIFYCLAIPAVVINGMAKGGLGNILGCLSVPLMALVIDPIQAAAILLPLLLVMDLLSLWKFRGEMDLAVFKSLLPGCLFGVVIAAFGFQYLSPDALRLFIGIVSIGFCVSQLLQTARSQSQVSSGKGFFWGSLTGVASYGIHAGGPPFSIYILPMKLESRILMGTQAWIFGSMNVAKVCAYATVGQLNTENLSTSLVLLPLTPIGVLLGYWLLHRLSQLFIYRFCYISLALLGVTLTLQGFNLIPS
ncbi:sulfite exporter TauE/SafE family protein [Parendozoicomonas haliclonae]|nr:sulfite exporter TauE/SafE family protein [Parendozoicomonas haliclonae]